ncbi:hypothetical protein AAZX31_01G093100 [Glycine max]|uniref:DUF4220 domain-containing protein n=1 Tax=Glycine max TaxID=3847 RepID=I1J6Y9_SOYBN|nr:uncharacterized protein LOC102662220 [Glycine max]KAH1162474.1 hypothetical protein GYH30_001102 [Glycine max]KRH75697.1 hypothetical protein GLYMA_01G102200v4 [Glycine max]|eukprot:XP_006573315.1 uncharacterized protein LOC102662220 [Glycine max]
MLLLPIIVTYVSIEGHRRLDQVIPDSMLEWWDKWELRGLILLSLVSQIILTLLGDRRKRKPSKLRRALVWSSYLLEDKVETVAMGVISSNLGEYYNKGEQPKNVNPQLLAFWAPFFLMHLGGPDTITAYALEDNELWLRHFVGLLSQTSLTVYVIILSWKGDWLSHLTIPMLIIGIIKYGERTWSLYRASIKHLRDSFLRSIDSSRKSDQWQESRASSLCGRILNRVFPKKRRKNGGEDLTPIGDPTTFLRAICIFISLFVDLVMNPWDITKDREEVLEDLSMDFTDYFTLVNFELKLMYDVFYTKAFANYGVLGLVSRLITLTTTIVVLVSYPILSENEHLFEDHIITYLLLVGALISEIYAFILVAFSRWTFYYISIKGLSAFSLIPTFMLDVIIKKNEEDNFSSVMGQSNLLNLICNKNLNIKGNFFPMNKLEELPSVSHCLTSKPLETMILQHLQDKSKKGLQSNPLGAPGFRNLLFGKNVSIFTSELEFHRTIITWHIATNLFYYSNEDSMSSVVNSRKNCKEMSDYMFYLLLKQRHMLPVGAALVTLQDTVIDAVECFKRKNVVPRQDNLPETCTILLQHDIATTGDDKASKMQSASVMFHACNVAKELIAAENGIQMWKFVEELWVEILCYAGAQCRVDMHAQQLRRGPEFLSNVWLLQAHLGLLDQFQFVGSISDNSAHSPEANL